MSDVGRKVVALSIVILGAGLLWAGRRSYSDADDAKTEMNATIAAARERIFILRSAAERRLPFRTWRLGLRPPRRRSHLCWFSARLSARAGN